MSFILPNWIPRDPNILEGCINEEMKRLFQLQDEISKIEAKPANPFVFKNPSPDTKLPCSMTMKLLNTLIYKTNITDFDYSYEVGITHLPTIYIATAHEIHSFQVPIYKNNPIIKIPNLNIEIRSIAIFPESIITLFSNNEVIPYSLAEKSWKHPITLPFDQEINTMKRINNLIFFQTGPNQISVFNSTNYLLVNSKDLNTKTILECYLPNDSTECYFKTIEKDVIVVNIESMQVIHTVSLSDFFLFKLAIQSHGDYVFAYNDENTIQYNQNFKVVNQFDFGSTFMYAEADLIFFLSETSQNQLLNDNESQTDPQKDEENYSEEEESDVNISLSIASIKTREVLAVLSISHINIVSFKIIFTKFGERCIIIKGDDNSLSFWNFTFGVPQKDEHGRVILKQIGGENQKFSQQQQQQPMVFINQNQQKLKNLSPRKASMRPLINNQQMTIINAPISPVNQATSVHVVNVADSQNASASHPQMNVLASPRVQLSQQHQNAIPTHMSNVSLNENQQFTQNTPSSVPATKPLQNLQKNPNKQIMSNLNVTPSNTSGNDINKQVHTHKFAPLKQPQGNSSRPIQPLLQNSQLPPQNQQSTDNK